MATDGYGKPSKYEANVQRRPSPGLTQTAQASVSFAPLQSLFGIVTPSGLHFERHHQGWWDIDPSKHRLMVNGMVKTPMVFTMDDLMRLPSVSRMHFIECGANTGMEWGNVAVPTVQYTHGMLSCCEYTGVRLATLLELCGLPVPADIAGVSLMPSVRHDPGIKPPRAVLELDSVGVHLRAVRTPKWKFIDVIANNLSSSAPFIAAEKDWAKAGYDGALLTLVVIDEDHLGGLIGHRFDQLAVHIDARPVAAQGLAELLDRKSVV